MTLQTVARRYTMALHDVAAANGSLDRVERDLLAIRDLVAAHPPLQQVLGSAAVPPAKKRAVLDAVLGQVGDLADEVRRTLQLLADRDRLGLLPDVAARLVDRLNQTRRQMAATVVTAVPMPDDRRVALEQALGHVTGNTVTVAGTVDPAIIGGLVARVGSVVYDGSITRQLERMREKLLADA